MGRRTAYPPGTFSWVELATSDGAAARRFYGGLFGWEIAAAGDGGVPAVCRLDGDAVCAIAEMPRGVRATGVPPSWTSHVTVPDTAAVARRAQALGGAVVAEPSPVPGAGTAAVLRDPQGALVAVWQPDGWAGAERVNDPGCLCMNELITTDAAGARAFYGALFGWEWDDVDAGDGAPVAFLRNDGAINGSVFAAAGPTPAHWRPCFTVPSVEEATARVRELDGAVLHPGVLLPDGNLALVRDPQGAVLSLFAGETDP
ncbi:MAG TPA: VOC family protein [Miltoncostaeaceae bacterium]|nr:VOC family protein [Miltoncostaeaceae bacterium]